jgi:hypothetical protein
MEIVLSLIATDSTESVPPPDGVDASQQPASSLSTLLPNLPWKRRESLVFLLMIAVAVAALLPLWDRGIPNAGDMLMSLYRISELQDAWKQGVYYPRFGLGLNFGYGAPLFQFYPPLASYIGLVVGWLGLGLITTTKLLMSAELIVGGLGVYVYARRLLTNRAAALVAALIYILSPYLLLVIYERGAVAEGLALSLLPWLMWSSHSLYSDGRRRDFLFTAALTACFILAHNITAFFVFPAVVVYISALALIGRRGSALLPLFGAFALGVGMSAFYWAPALGELRFSRAAQHMLSGVTDVRNNLTPLWQVVQPRLLHEYAGDLRFRFSLWQFALGCAGVIGLIVRRRERRYALWLLALGWFVTLLLQADFSLTFWDHAPLVRFIQLPWRLFGLGSLCVALLAGSLFTARPLSGRVAWGVAAVLIAALFWLSTANLRADLFPFWHRVDESGVNRLDLWERGRAGYPLFSDYAPIDLNLDSGGFTRGRLPDDPTLLPPVVAPKISIVSENPVRFVMDVSAAQPWTLRLHRLFFPGWQVSIDGRSVTIGPSGIAGLVTAELPAGDYRLIAEFADSPLRLAANLISIVSLAIWLAAFITYRRPWHAFVAVATIALLLTALIWYARGAGRPARTPPAFPVQFEQDLQLLAYDLPQTELCAGRDAPLRLYWFAGKTPPANYKLFVHVAQLDDSGVVAQFDTEPSGGFNPMTRWESGEFVVDEIVLNVADSVAPGRYQLLAGLYHPETVQNLRVLGAPAVLPGDRLLLSEVTVCE